MNLPVKIVETLYKGMTLNNNNNKKKTKHKYKSKRETQRYRKNTKQSLHFHIVLMVHFEKLKKSFRSE